MLMTPTQLNYFNQMKPGQTLSVEQVKDPEAMVSAGKEYIDQFGCLELNPEYTIVKKLRPLPPTDEITFFALFDS